MTSPEMFSLDGKVIIVTGGTRRYGSAFCDGLAEAQATVCLTSRSQERADERAEEIRQRGYEAHGYALELADDDSIEQFVQAVLHDHGRIDVLINNARALPPAAFGAITREELHASFDVNIIGAALLTRRVVEEMRAAGGGNIINIGSIYGMGGQYPTIYKDPEKSLSMDYPLQKGGVIAWTKQLATILAGDGIRANCLSLGGLREESHDDHFLEGYRLRTPMRRMARAEDVKGPIVFLASDASGYMTGANLVVDGGWTAW
ncbi:MAG: SDR family NAD(P)-dependent oxidoreductase [Armatimonadota bacterium]